jgi:hypothetical protein
MLFSEPFKLPPAFTLKKFHLLGYTLCSPLKFNRRFGGTSDSVCCLLMSVSCSIYSLTLKMEATYFSEMSFDIQRTIRRYIPEDRTVHNHRCENLKSYNIKKTSFCPNILIYQHPVAFVKDLICRGSLEVATFCRTRRL